MELLGERGRVKFKIIKIYNYYRIEARSPYFEKYNEYKIFFDIRKSKSSSPGLPYDPAISCTDSCCILNYYPINEVNAIYNCYVYVGSKCVDEIKFYVN